MTLTKTGDRGKLAFVANQTSPGSDEVHDAEDALARAAGRHDAGALKRAIAEAQATIAKNRPACAPPFSLPPLPRRSSDAGVLNGRLDPNVIQYVVRANFGRVKLCYQDALRKDPSTGGRIETRFVIGLDGTVSSVSDASKPDGGAPDALRACVRNVFTRLTFPPPDGGVVTVIYPLILSPGAD